MLTCLLFVLLMMSVLGRVTRTWKVPNALISDRVKLRLNEIRDESVEWVKTV
jgi:hypothetical protein